MGLSAGGREKTRCTLVGRFRQGPRVASGWCALTLGFVLVPTAARAEPPPGPDTTDSYSLQVRSATYLQLYQRALLPGPDGAIVATTMPAPATEYCRSG